MFETNYNNDGQCCEVNSFKYEHPDLNRDTEPQDVLFEDEIVERKTPSDKNLRLLCLCCLIVLMKYIRRDLCLADRLDIRKSHVLVYLEVFEVLNKRTANS
jgi:hypothetical protein